MAFYGSPLTLALASLYANDDLETILYFENGNQMYISREITSDVLGLDQNQHVIVGFSERELAKAYR